MMVNNRPELEYIDMVNKHRIGRRTFVANSLGNVLAPSAYRRSINIRGHVAKPVGTNGT
jgi:hypothetical protein